MSTSAPLIRPPLRLPAGSVRAVLALLLCGTLWYLVLRGRAIPDVLAQAALLVVAFYFGVRGTIPFASPPSGPGAGSVRQPLFLPRGSVRTLLLVGFFGVIVYTWYGGRAIPDTLVLILQVLVSYVIGFLFSSLLLRRVRAEIPPSRAAGAVRNSIALAAMGITGFACWSLVVDRFDLVPSYLQNALAWTIAFYFGSRLGP